MEVIVKEEARKDLADLDPDIKDIIIDQIEELEENATPDNSTYIEIGSLDLFRIKLQEEDRNSRLNHRIFYQIEDEKVYERGIFHREKGYGKETERELKSRI
ncbi:MAG: type II toxin-antitoxin system RelE/ParE family toxin [Candidatus Nanohaloarchaea archaeon]